MAEFSQMDERSCWRTVTALGSGVRWVAVQNTDLPRATGVLVLTCPSTSLPRAGALSR